MQGVAKLLKITAFVHDLSSIHIESFFDRNIVLSQFFLLHDSQEEKFSQFMRIIF